MAMAMAMAMAAAGRRTGPAADMMPLSRMRQAVY
jgi:hypothetical protein